MILLCKLKLFEEITTDKKTLSGRYGATVHVTDAESCAARQVNVS